MYTFKMLAFLKSVRNTGILIQFIYYRINTVAYIPLFVRDSATFTNMATTVQISVTSQMASTADLSDPLLWSVESESKIATKIDTRTNIEIICVALL